MFQIKSAVQRKVWFYAIWFYAVMFYAVWFYAVMFYAVWFYAVMFCFLYSEPDQCHLSLSPKFKLEASFLF